MNVEQIYDLFEKSIIDYLGEKMKVDDELCKRVWGSMANVDWYYVRPSDRREDGSCISVGYSFRAAGGLIARIIGRGDYMDWYCSSEEGVVDEEFRRVMKKNGFIPDDHPGICDEPGCLEDASCGFPSGTVYRWTCYKHGDNG